MLRNITIRVTGLTLIATFMMVFGYFLVRASHYSDFSLVKETIPCVVIGMICNLPLIVSGILLLVLKRLKHSISLIILLLSTIVFGSGMLYALYDTWGSYGCMSGIQFFGNGFGSFCYMIPAWIIALLLNSFCEKKTSEPENAPE